MLLYILGELERSEKLNFKMLRYDDVLRIANRRILVDVFEDDYEYVKKETLGYFKRITP